MHNEGQLQEYIILFNFVHFLWEQSMHEWDQQEDSIVSATSIEAFRACLSGD
jgi:hypothetical protein